MFPLHTTVISYHAALVTWVIIGLNTIAFLFELSLPPDSLTWLIHTYGMVPARVAAEVGTTPLGLPATAWGPFLTSMFLHGGWLHLLGNMWTFWVFGQHVEDRMGHGRFLLFYLLCGIGSGVVHVTVNPSMTTPAIGASGAISGVLGAYLLLFFASRVVVMIPIFFFPFIFDFPAVLYLGYWFLLQLVSGVWALAGSGQQGGGIAFWAHVGGFLVGVATFSLFLRPRAQRMRLHPDQGDRQHGWTSSHRGLGIPRRRP